MRVDTVNYGKERRKAETLARRPSKTYNPLDDGCVLGTIAGKVVLSKMTMPYMAMLVRPDTIVMHDCTMAAFFSDLATTDWDHVERLAGTVGMHRLPPPKFVEDTEVGRHWRASERLLSRATRSNRNTYRFAEDLLELLEQQRRMEQLLQESRVALETAIAVCDIPLVQEMIAATEPDEQYDETVLDLLPGAP